MDRASPAIAIQATAGGNNIFNLTVESDGSEIRAVAQQNRVIQEALLANQVMLQTLVQRDQGAVLTTDATTAIASAVERHLDTTIDGCRDTLMRGKPRAALALFETFFASLEATASDRIRFRIKANMGHCLLALGQEDAAANMLDEAVAFAPGDPKAIANKVLALVLRDEHKDAFDLARVELEKSPENDTLAFYLMQAAQFLPEVVNPLVFIPSPLHEKKIVLTGLIDFKRSRDETGAWWELAHHALSIFPDDDMLAQLAAEATLDRIARESNVGTWRLTSAMRDDVEKVLDVLAKAWKRAEESETPDRPDHLAFCGNFALAQHLTGDFSGAIQTLEAGLRHAPGDEPLAVRLALLAFESGDLQRAKAMFDLLPERGEGAQIKCQIAARVGNWEYLARLDPDSVRGLPESEQAPFRTLLDRARLLQNRPSDALDQLRRLIAGAKGNGRSSILLAGTAGDLGHFPEEIEAYGNAIDAVTDETHISGRSMIADYASRRDDAEVVAAMLDGHVVTDIDNGELRMLARAFAHMEPPTRRGIEFFEELPDAIRELDHYRSCEGVFHFRRGSLDLAERCFLALHSRSPNDLWPILSLFQIYNRTAKPEDFARLIEGQSSGSVKGTADQRMGFAQALLCVDRDAEALALGYELLRANANLPEFHLQYIGLIIGTDKSPDIPQPTKVDIGCWVLVETDAGEKHQLLIERGDDRPVDNIYSPSNPLVQALFGKAVGDEYEAAGALGMIHKGRILEIKHRYLHALHDALEHFNRRFPGHPGLRRILTSGEDISEILDVVKRRGEHVEELLKTYADRSLPMAFIARGWRHAMAFAATVRASGGIVHVALGDLEERQAALESIGKAEAAVLDTFTFWTAADLDALDILKLVFPRLAVPRSVLDDLASLKPAVGGDGQGRMGYRNGQYFLHQELQKDIEAFERDIDSKQNALSEHCEVVPVAAPDELSNLTRVILHSFDKQVLDPLFVASERGWLLLCEELGYRKIAAQTLPVKTAWLQAVFLYAATNGLITVGRYAELIAGLARRGHSHLAMDVNVLLLAHWSGDEGRFKAVADHIGTQHAEIYSHLRVSLEFLAKLWKQRDPSVRDQAATGRLIECLVRHRPREAVEILDLIVRIVPATRQYVVGWAKGHFIAWPAPAALHEPARPKPQKPGKKNKKTRRRQSGR